MGGRIGAVDPLENDIDGEWGGGDETGLSSLDIDNVDLRRNQGGLTVLSPWNSKAGDPDGWLAGVCGSGVVGCRTSSDSSAGLISDIERAVHMPRLNLLEDDNGRPNEVRLRNLVVGAEVGWAGGDGLEGPIGADRDSSKVKREGAFLLPEAGL